MLKYIIFIILMVSVVFGDLYFDYQIPMRDGKWLAADLWTLDSTIAKPVILLQTPYDRTTYRAFAPHIDPLDTNRFFDFVHYNFVIVDWRGFHGSTEATTPGYDRGLDGYDCVEWIAERPWSNGRVGTYGGSALGMQQFKTIWQHPPHLVCAAPWIKDYMLLYSNYYPGGVLKKEHALAHEMLGFITMDFLLEHQLCCDLFWNYREFTTDNPEDIHVPLLMLTGWFDHAPDDIIRAFHDVRARSVDSVRAKHKFIVGPWTHSDIGTLVQGELEFPAAVDAQAEFTKKFFARYLREADNGYEDMPVGSYFVMQSDEWIETDDWYSVATGNDTFYLAESGVLTDEFSDITGDYSQFEYDPRNPTPAYGTERFVPGVPAIKIGPWDIGDTVESRDDVLVFSTETLTSDVTLAGMAKCILYVSTDRLDTDIAIRITDVYPDGRSIVLANSIRRMRLLESYAEENLITPGEVYPVEIELRNLAQTFRAGHRIRIVISGAIYPLYDRNLNNGGAMYAEGDTLISTTTIHHSPIYPSALILPTISDFAAYNEEALHKPKELSLSLYPNPFNSSVYIKMSDDLTMVGIYDIVGKQIVSGDKIGERWKPTSHIKSGIYFVAAKDDKGNIALAKALFIR